MRKIFWIKCDIDGRGEKWRIAIESWEDIGEEEIMDTYLFPMDEYEDCRENFEAHEKIEITMPSAETSKK